MNSPEAQAARAERIRTLLENDEVREILAQLRDFYVRAWLDGASVEAREDAHRHVKVLEKFQADIRAISLEGELARGRMAELRGEKSRRWFG